MSDAARGISCEGWWQQRGFGRQPMLELFMEFDGGQISGSGRDLVGPFMLAGTIDAKGHVVMVKDYLGQHNVDYFGTYDGEGLMWGEWHIGPVKDRWMIKLKGAKGSTAKQAAIAEIV
jgi:hypothetical protein